MSRVSDPTQYALYNKSYTGKTYSVKYLGIVDGTMGILSRKMALTTSDQAAMAIKPDDPTIPNISPQMQQIIAEDNRGIGDVMVLQTEGKGPLPKPFAPVLGKKNYTESIGRTRRNRVIDETNRLIAETHNFGMVPYSMLQPGGQIMNNQVIHIQGDDGTNSITPVSNTPQMKVNPIPNRSSAAVPGQTESILTQ